jgi:deoxyribose-phosphate aldolase
MISAAILIQAIQRFGDMSRGLKVSGGIRHYEQAKMYYLLGQMMIGESWPKPQTIRIGASSLLDDIAAQLGAT